MSRIILSKSAIKKLMDDPKLREWRRDGEPGPRVPCLLYYQRFYSTSHDGIVTEYGDGFSLTTIDLTDAEETESIVLTSVAVADGFDILVEADASRMSGSFMIGVMKKFTYEPLESS